MPIPQVQIVDTKSPKSVTESIVLDYKAGEVVSIDPIFKDRSNLKDEEIKISLEKSNNFIDESSDPIEAKAGSVVDKAKSIIEKRNGIELEALVSIESKEI